MIEIGGIDRTAKVGPLALSPLPFTLARLRAKGLKPVMTANPFFRIDLTDPVRSVSSYGSYGLILV